MFRPRAVSISAIPAKIAFGTACGTTNTFLPEIPDFAPHRTKPMLMPVDWDGSVSRARLVLSEASLIDDVGLGHPAIDAASALAQLIEIMKGDL
jgi:hypothetical protein